MTSRATRESVSHISVTRGAKPLCINLFCGLGGAGGYPGQLVIQDVLTLHGSQFKSAAVIVASPPCQKYSYMAMPWTRAKALADWYRKSYGTIKQLNALFDACFRIQREACEAAGRHIPLIVENVKGAQPWVGPAKWHYGSFYLFGDVPALMPMAKAFKSSGMNWSDQTKRGQDFTRIAGKQAMQDGRKVPMNFHEHEKTGKPGRSFQSTAVADCFGLSKETPLRDCNSKSPRRKAASAQIAKIPPPLSSWIARTFKPTESLEATA